MSQHAYDNDRKSKGDDCSDTKVTLNTKAIITRVL